MITPDMTYSAALDEWLEPHCRRITGRSANDLRAYAKVLHVFFAEMRLSKIDHQQIERFLDERLFKLHRGKNRHRRRTVPLTDEAFDSLQERYFKPGVEQLRDTVATLGATSQPTAGKQAETEPTNNPIRHPSALQSTLALGGLWFSSMGVGNGL